MENKEKIINVESGDKKTIKTLIDYFSTPHGTHGDITKRVFKIPVGNIGNKKKWWEFWKKDKPISKEEIESLISKYKEEIEFPENTDFFIPVKNNDKI